MKDETIEKTQNIADTSNSIQDKDNSPGHDKEFTIIVNGREKNWSKKEISFEEVVELAFGTFSTNPNIVYTVTYKRGHGNKPEGIMVGGDSVKVKEGMIFNATQTDKS